MLFGGENSLPTFLARQHFPGLDVMVDPCAAVLVLIVTGLLCLGIKEVLSISFYFQFLFHVRGWYPSPLVNCNLEFKTCCPSRAECTCTRHCHNCKCICHAFCNNSWWLSGFQNWMDWIWSSYWVMAFHAVFPSLYDYFKIFYWTFSSYRFFPFGVDGMLAGSATVFFSYIGFDTVASTAEEVYGFFSFGSLPFIKSCLFWWSKELETVHDRWRIPNEICHWVLRYPSPFVVVCTCWFLL